MKLERTLIGSSTSPTTNYLVTVVDRLPVACTCPAFAYATVEYEVDRMCKHMKKVYANQT